MLVGDAIRARLSGGGTGPSDEAPRLVLPRLLKGERDDVHVRLLRRVSASRCFALGDRKGALRAAQRRSGRAFRLDVRQRVVVKALVSRHAERGAARGGALARHQAYLGRSGAGADGERPAFFGRSGTLGEPASATRDWSADRHHFRFIVSPEHGARIVDLGAYTREVMARVAADLGEPELAWIGVCHFDTDQPHAHVLVRGRRADGTDLVIPRDYIAYGFRARAQEVAQELLGDLSRSEAERRVWREVDAERFTGLDRRLLAAMDAERLVDDGLGRAGAWAALTRGRLRTLEQLGLAEPVGRRYRLAADLETRLRGLQTRVDIIRSLNQRRLETGRAVRPMEAGSVRGRVVARGWRDELGASAFVIVSDHDGVEHYARLQGGVRPPEIGREIHLSASAQGAGIVAIERGGGLDR